MRPGQLVALICAISLLPSCAGRAFTATKYRPAGIIGGYSEKEIEPGIWRVEGRSNGIAETGFGRNMAMYRAAEIMKQRGFTKFHIVDQKGTQSSFRMGYSGSSQSSGEEMQLFVTGAKDGGETPMCRSKIPSACFLVEIEPTMQRLAPLLYIESGKPPADR